MGQKKKPGQAARCVRCCSGFASLPAWWCRAAGLPGAVVVLIGGRRRAPARPHSFPRHSSSRNRSRAVQFRRRMIRQNAAGRRGQILHLTAYRPIGNGELGSMPPYYPPLAPFFPGFRRGLLNFQRLALLLHSGIEGIKYIILQTFSAGNSCGADCCAFAPFRANRDTIPACVVFIARHFVRF